MNSFEGGEQQIRFVQQRIDKVEKFLGNFCFAMGKYVRKTAHLRDAGDNLVRACLDLAVNENLNQSIRINVTRYADSIGAVQDFRQAEILRLESKIVQELNNFKGIIKLARGDASNSLKARQKELRRKQRIENLRGQLSENADHLTEVRNFFIQLYSTIKAETDLKRLSHNVTDSLVDLEIKVEEFEKKKIQLTKSLLKEFVNIEMVFHAKSLEMLTEAYNHANSIDRKADLAEFKLCLTTPALLTRWELSTQSQSTQPSLHRPLPRVQKSATMKSERPYSDEIRNATSDDSDDEEETVQKKDDVDDFDSEFSEVINEEIFYRKSKPKKKH